MNKGYVGYSRSVRSQRAIEDFEMPLSLIKKDVILDFLNEHKEEYNESDLNYLKNLSIAKWKYVAKEHTSRASWHHTSSYFNKTDHYDLFDVANKAIELKNDLDELYKNSLNQDVNVQFGVMKVQIWGGSRRRPKLEGHEIVAGVILNDWLYYKVNHNKDGATSKYKTTANKVEWLDEFDSYDELIKKHKRFKNTKRVFNSLIKEKVKK